MKKEENKELEEELGIPVCEKCGSAKVKEDGEWLCPHCQGEIDFLGDDDE